ncbi:MAG: hypothetical protein IPL91_12345 [Hyphomicrobium sp.]|nr:hypothetical protein [Hyphomicrobium sp.]
MKLIVPAIAALAAVFTVASTIPSDAAPKKYSGKYYATNSGKVKSKGPLKGVIYGRQRRIGGYSYSYSDVMQPNRFAHSPVATGLYESGPIDSDFFYPRPSGPFGGYTPYMH